MFLMLAILSVVPAAAEESSPIGKILEMISDLQSKVIAEGEDSHKVFAEFSEWCEDENRNFDFSIKTALGEIDTFNTKIEELAAELALDTADLKAASEIRAKEQSDFSAELQRRQQAVLADAVRAAVRRGGQRRGRAG